MSTLVHITQFLKATQSKRWVVHPFVLLFLVLIVQMPKANGQTRLDDSISLVGLYNTTNGAAWNNTWNLSTPMDNWYGVTLTSGRVTCLDLDGAPTCQYGVIGGGNGLTGNLPNLNLTELVFFSVINNNLAGNIPSFSNTTNLVWLLLDFNNFSGNIPNFPNLGKLRILSIVNNNLVGSIPDFLGMPSLEDFYFNLNSLSGAIPNFTNLVELVNLNAFGNSIAGNIPDFTNLPNLQRINLSRNNIIGSIPNFSNLTNLIELDVHANNLTGTIPDFSNLPLLRNCYINANQLTGTIPDFTNLPDLKRLNAGVNQLTGTIPDFTNLPDLINLQARSNQLTGNIPDFSNVPSLILIDLNSNLLTGPIPNFSNCPALQSINVSYNGLSSSIPNFTNLPTLQQLILRNNELADSIPDFSNLPILNYADFRNNKLISPVPDFSSLPDLSVLLLSDNNLTGLIPAFTNLSTLQDFTVFNNQLTFEDLIDSRAFLEATCNLNGGTYLYAPQDTVSFSQSLFISQGALYIFDLEIDDTVTTSTYEWYKDNVLTSTTNSNKLLLPNFQQSDEALYCSEITNANAPNLTLISYCKSLFFQGNCEMQADIVNTVCGLDGSIELTPISGTGPYTFNWSDGTTTSTISNATPGTYAVTVVDGVGCTFSNTYTISHQEKLVIEWEQSYGGTLEDQPFCIIESSDGNFVTAGRSISQNGDVSNPKGDYDFWITKLSPTGALLWEKSYGGTAQDNAFVIRETTDKGFIVTGSTISDDGDVTGHQGQFDYWVLRLDVNGNLLWEKTLGGSSTDQASDVVETPDGGFVVVGQSISNNGDVSNQIGLYDYWVVKLDANGIVVWDKSYGGTQSDDARSIQLTNDNGFIVAGVSSSSDGQITNPNGGEDAWVIRLDSAGNLLWEKSLGGSGEEYAEHVIQSDDGGFVLFCTTNSTDGDISTSLGGFDYWVVKLDGIGTLLGEQSFGGSDQEYITSGFQKSDKEFIVTGYSNSSNGDVSNPKGFSDYWVLNLDNGGNLIWEMSLGGSKNDVAYGSCQTNDGAIMIAGRSNSDDQDVSQNFGDFDNWIVKLGLNLPMMPQATTFNQGTGIGNGEVEMITETGTPTYTLNWENLSGNPPIFGTLNSGDGTDTITGLSNGDYNITVTDANGCIGTTYFNVCDLEVSLNTVLTTCYEDNGSITATTSGGTGSYTYLWSNGATGAVISNLAAGSYSLTVTSGLGCTKVVNTVLSFQGIPVIEWQSVIGGSNADLGNQVQPTSDGGYVFTGYTESNDGDIPIQKGFRDLVIGKVDQMGSLLWLQTYGGTIEDIGHILRVSSNDEIYIAGTSNSIDGDIPSTNESDIILLKLDNFGNLLWINTYGGSLLEGDVNMEQLPNGDLLIAGTTNSNDGDVSSNNGGKDIWVFRTDTNGSLLWEHSYGGPGNENVFSIFPEDNGFLIGGFSSTVGGDVTTNNGSNDSWIFRSDYQGNILLNKSYGGAFKDAIRSIKKTNDGYITAGYNYTSSNNSNYEIIKWDNTWNVLWQKSYGGTNIDFAIDLLPSTNNGCIVSGWANSNDGDVIGNHGGADNWILKLDDNGNLEWQKTVGSTGHDTGVNLTYTADGGFVTIGRASANNGDVSGHNGAEDIWIVKFNQPDPITLACTLVDAGTGSNDGMAVLSTSGGVPPFTIAWEDGAGLTDTIFNSLGQDTIQNLPGGSITFTVIDQNDCLNNCTLDFCAVILNTTAQFSDCYEPNGALTTAVNPGYSYLWSNGATTPDIFDLNKGTYTLTVTDSNGCSRTQSHIISYNGYSGLEWQQSLGGTSDDHLKDGVQTNDGGYIFTGRTLSNDINVTLNNGLEDIWVVKTNDLGNIQWEKSFGGGINERSESIQQTKDGGYIVAGRTSSTDGDVVGNNGSVDFWLIKLDNAGNLIWQKCLGGTLDEQAFQVQQTIDGGYVVVGHSYSSDGDVSQNKGSSDIWVVRLDQTGNIEWEKSLGGSDFDFGESIQQTKDRGFILTGRTLSNDGDVTGQKGNSDFWIVKLSDAGSVQWQRPLGGSLDDVGYSIIQTNDDGYIATGYTFSNDVDVFGNHGGKDLWVIKLDNLGNTQWQNALGGSGNEEGREIIQTSDGNYLVTGFTASNNGDVTSSFNSTRYWIVKLFQNGVLDWEMTFGGQTDLAFTEFGIATNDGGYLLGGATNSTNGNITNNIGSFDYWVAKINQIDTFQIEATKTTDILCAGGSGGAATVSTTGGYPPYSYNWSNGVFGTTTTGLSANTYYVSATDRNGCEIVDTLVINDPFPITISATIDSTYCDTANGSIALSVSGGTPPYQYSLNGGAFQTNSVFNPLGAGNYTVLVKDGNDCLDSIQTTIFTLLGATIDSLNITSETCGSMNGSVLVFTSGGLGNLEFSIDGITYQPINLFGNLSQGSYTIYVSDDAGCINTVNATIPAFTSPTLDSVSIINATCGANNGQATINATGGTSPLQYSIDNSTYQPSNQFTLGQGNYIAYVQDANSCTATASFTITQANGPAIDSVSLVQATCGANNGQATINATGGTSPLQYSIDNSTYQPSNQFTLGQGSYTAYVQDANSCTATASFTITQANGPEIDSVQTVNTDCGLINGTLEAFVTGGALPLSYSIDNGTTNQPASLFTGLVGGTYTVLVTDANGCFATASGQVVSNIAPAIDSIAITDAICSNNTGALTIHVSNGTSSITYSIDNGTTSQPSNTFTGLTPGQYTILVADAGGCTSTALSDSIKFFNAPSLQFFQGITDTYCGQSIGQIVIQSNGGTHPLQYSIDGGLTYQPSDSFPNLSSGSYTIVVLDANGCMDTRTANIDDNPGPTLSTTLIQPTCGQSNGSITAQVTANGVPPFLYNIDGGTFTTNNTFNNLTQSTYTIIVEDSKSCRDTISVTLTPLLGPSIDQVQITDATCGNNNGSLVITASGAVPPFQYSADSGVNYQGSNVFNGLSPSNYTVFVQDANGCTVSAQYTVSDLDGPAIDSVGVVNSACGMNSGEVVLYTSGGTNPVIYSIDNINFQSSNTFSSLAPATYTFYIKDDNNCIIDTTVAIIELLGPSIDSLSIDHPDCMLSNGMIQFNTTGGTLPLEYSVDNGVSYVGTNVFSNLAPASYQVVVRDANGCLATSTALLMNQNGPSIVTISSTFSNCDSNTGTLYAQVAGGTTPYSYSWSTSPPQTAVQATGLAVGTYTVTVTDASGCLVVGQQTVGYPTIVQADLGPDRAICGVTSLVLDHGVQGVNAIWSTGETTATINVGNAGNYSVTITDINNCESIDSINLIEIPFNPSVQGDTTIVKQNSTPLSAFGGLNYVWWPADDLSCAFCSNPISTPEDTTTYFVEISGTGNCKDTLSVKVNVIKSLDEIIAIPDVISPNNDGINDAWIIPNIELFPYNRVVVVNRWGDVIFSASPYTNNWRGDYDGKPLPQGTYYYVLEPDVNQFRRQTGTVSLIR